MTRGTGCWPVDSGGKVFQQPVGDALPAALAMARRHPDDAPRLVDGVDQAEVGDVPDDPLCEPIERLRVAEREREQLAHLGDQSQPPPRRLGEHPRRRLGLQEPAAFRVQPAALGDVAQERDQQRPAGDVDAGHGQLHRAGRPVPALGVDLDPPGGGVRPACGEIRAQTRLVLLPRRRRQQIADGHPDDLAGRPAEQRRNGVVGLDDAAARVRGDDRVECIVEHRDVTGGVAAGRRRRGALTAHRASLPGGRKRCERAGGRAGFGPRTLAADPRSSPPDAHPGHHRRRPPAVSATRGRVTVTV